MKRKKRSSQEKLIIVLEGMQNRVPLGELCSRHQITQSQYYQWKDRLLKHGAHVFDFGGPDKENERLRKENTQLKSFVGELTVELKKNRGHVMVARKRAESVGLNNETILEQIHEIKADHPAWGYRRVWAYLKYRQGLEVNKKRIYRLLKEHHLLAH